VQQRPRRSVGRPLLSAANFCCNTFSSSPSKQQCQPDAPIPVLVLHMSWRLRPHLASGLVIGWLYEACLQVLCVGEAALSKDDDHQSRGHGRPHLEQLTRATESCAAAPRSRAHHLRNHRRSACNHAPGKYRIQAVQDTMDLIWGWGAIRGTNSGPRCIVMAWF